jgi:serine/threonine protein kinase
MTAADALVAGRYRVSAYLGAGGMGRVWLARDEVLRRDVAIKEIALPFGLSDEEREEMQERTLREARAAGRLSHPNVIRVYDVYHGQERPWIVMEYVPSHSLLDLIKANGPLPPEQVAGIGLAVLSALQAANRVGVLHRDVKPSNVLIAEDGRVVLTDFGSAMIDEGEGALTRTGVILGSPRYISPERARDGVATPESDLWSLGATLYEAVEGRAPYTRETTLETLIALATEKPDPVRLAGPLKPVLNGLLQKNPKDRIKPNEVEERLRRIADVHSAIRLREVPAARRPADLGEVMQFGGPWTPAAAATPQEGVYVDQHALALPAAPARSTDFPGLPAATAEPRTAPRSGRSPARRRQLIAGGAVTTVAAIALGTIVFVVTDNSDPRVPASAAVQPSAGSSSTSPSAAPSSSAAASNALPAGFKWYQSKSGFRVAYPVGWTKLKTETRSFVQFCHPGGPPLLTVRDWQPSDPDLSLALAREETAAAMSDYRRLRMEVSPQQDGALWEYTYTNADPKMGRLHVVDQVFVASGRAYILEWATPADKWSQFLDELTVVTDSFRPNPSPKSDALPAGFTWYTSPSGFRVATPTRWTKAADRPTSVLFRAPAGAPLLGVREWNPSDSDLGTALSNVERNWRQEVRNYRRISMDVLPQQGGAVWEYTYTDPNTDRRMHGLERAFVVSGKTYVIQWRTPASKWSANLANLGVVTASFRTSATG